MQKLQRVEQRFDALGIAHVTTSTHYWGNQAHQPASRPRIDGFPNPSAPETMWRLIRGRPATGRAPVVLGIVGKQTDAALVYASAASQESTQTGPGGE